MKFIPTLSLLSLCPSIAWSARCNADNVLRALRANQAKASPFCSTYTSAPASQPLPTYVSQYPVSRVSSACSCLITSTISSSSTSTPPSTSSSATSTVSSTATADACKSERIINGNFQTLDGNQPASWFFAPKMQSPGSSSVTNTSVSCNNVVANLYVLENSPNNFVGTTTYIQQTTRPLCQYTTYKLTYTSRISIINDGSFRRACSVRISIDGQTLVFIGPPNGDRPPFETETRETTFAGMSGQTFRVDFQCFAPGGSYTIDDISIVGIS